LLWRKDFVNNFYQCHQFQIIPSWLSGCIQYLFQDPQKDTSWIQKSGQFSLIQHVTYLIAKDCFEVDTDWSRTASESGINDLKNVILFQHGNQWKWIQKVSSWKNNNIWQCKTSWSLYAFCGCGRFGIWTCPTWSIYMVFLPSQELCIEKR